jgi:hypothetical protein
MFGHDWENAQATIVARKELRGYGDSIQLGKIKTYEYVADVQPPDYAPVFRATIFDPRNLTGWRPPEVGDVVPVTFDPKNLKVKFDNSAREDAKDAEKAAKTAAADQFKALRDAPPGVTAPSPSAPAGEPVAAAASGEHSMAGDPGDPRFQLQALEALHDRGEITDAMYAIGKAHALKQLGQS